MKLSLKNCRLSFPSLWEAEQFQGAGTFNYRAQFLIPEGSALKKKIDAAILSVAKEKFADKATGVLKAANATQKICFIDGNTKGYDGYAGHWALSTTREQSKGRPLILNADKSPLVESDGKPYPGCYVNASVEFWAQKNSFGNTVRCTLLGVQFAKDGDSFAAGSAASEDDFEDLGEGSAADDLV